MSRNSERIAKKTRNRRTETQVRRDNGEWTLFDLDEFDDSSCDLGGCFT